MDLVGKLNAELQLSGSLNPQLGLRGFLESEVFSTVATALRAEFTGIFVSGEHGVTE